MEGKQQPDSEKKKEDVYLEWSSPSRLFKRRDKEYFTNVGAIVVLLLIILVFAREFVLIAAVVSIVFLIYVLSTVPPEEIRHRISSLGIMTGAHTYRWEELGDFWFEEQWGQTMLVIRPFRAPREIILLAGQSKEKVKSIVGRYIEFQEEPQKNWVDNAASWITEKIPLDKPS
ncbi:hypothetical protein M1555_04035 [Patescibacteria group bacterium]|nr:hypothetical protein [Patescibacteria group bacterium]